MWLDYRPCSRFHTSKENQGMIQVPSNFDQTHPFASFAIHLANPTHEMSFCSDDAMAGQSTSSYNNGRAQRASEPNGLIQLLEPKWLRRSQQSSMVSLSSRSSVGYAEGLQPFCTQIVLAVHLRLATLWFDCHRYRRGMNRYRSPRVFISLLLLYY